MLAPAIQRRDVRLSIRLFNFDILIIKKIKEMGGLQETAHIGALNALSNQRCSVTNFVTRYASIASLPPSEP
ncbi:hypothetical protein AWB83_05797 [Caballeronia ptereochthonis]|uniref:Uncharacterized protein n=1 Tax=Caballeronia ptereochthonis TaxID=1777144 RepID=A0A158DS48_9BURK|nr:hypothetical protein AWB83_05797 [Caballeronia ptereochthonis]